MRQVRQQVARIGGEGDLLRAGLREDSRPSHMSVLRNRRFVEGKGRRYIDSVDGSPQPYGLTTLTTLNSAAAGA